MVHVSQGLNNQYQTGFVHGRCVADNGLAVRLAMEHAASTRANDIGLSLDMEKAYDRVHPDYLERCLQRWGFPTEIVRCIRALFFGTTLRINVNGALSPPVQQRR